MNSSRLLAQLILFCCLWLTTLGAVSVAADPHADDRETISIALPPLAPHTETETLAKPSHNTQTSHSTSPATPAQHAQADHPKNAPDKMVKQGLDIILVMDSSGSMKKNDPNDLRKPAAKLLLSLLGKDDRASIVSFSDAGYPVAYLTQTDSQMNSDILFGAVEKVSNKGAYTNLSGALKAAKRVVEQAWDEQRKHVIVLMSDGKMDLASAALDKKATAELVTQLLPELKEKGIQVHTIAFTDNSDQRLLQSIANLTEGHFNLARSDQDLHAVFASIFEQSKEPDILPMEGNYFTVDSNVREITIVANKASLATQISFTTPSGRVLEEDIRPGNVKWLVSEQFDLITIQNPESGEWEILPAGEENRAYIITNLKMALEINPMRPQPGDRVDINVWLEEDGEVLNKQQVLSALNVKLLQEMPTGETRHIAMLSGHDATGEFSGYFNTYLQMNDYGRYRVEVSASTGTFERIKSKVIDLVPPMKPEEVLHALEDPNSTAIQPLQGVENTHKAPKPPVYHQPAPAEAPQQSVEHHAEAPELSESPHDEQSDKQSDESEGGAMLAVIVFLLFNLVIALAIGTVWLIKRRNKKKLLAQAA